MIYSQSVVTLMLFVKSDTNCFEKRANGTISVCHREPGHYSIKLTRWPQNRYWHRNPMVLRGESAKLTRACSVTKGGFYSAFCRYHIIHWLSLSRSCKISDQRIKKQEDHEFLTDLSYRHDSCGVWLSLFWIILFLGCICHLLPEALVFFICWDTGVEVAQLETPALAS